MSVLEDFFTELDARWPHGDEDRTALRIIGSAALMFQTDYQRGTKDADVLEVQGLDERARSTLLKVAGKGTEMHARHHVHVDIVPNGLPFLPRPPRWHPLQALNGRLRWLELHALDVTDVVVSKLKRFNGNDAQDIEAMIDRELVPHGHLVERFRTAVDYFQGDARAEDLRAYVRNLHAVERDAFGVEESEIELPSWIG